MPPKRKSVLDEALTPNMFIKVDGEKKGKPTATQ